MRLIKIVFLLSIICTVSKSFGQTSFQDFGTGTGSHTSQTGSTAFLPNPTSGTTWARAGTVVPNAPVNLVNSANPLGTTGSYVRAAASAGASVCKFSPMIGYSAGTEFYTSFKVLLGNSSGGNSGATDGTWTFYQGNGTMYSDASDFTGAQVFTGLRFGFAVGGVVNLTYRLAGAFSTTGLTTTSYNQASVLNVEIVGNNKTSGTINYLYNGIAQSVAVQKFDLYINGILIGNDLGEALLPANTSLISNAFIGISSTANAANIFVDDVAIYNSVPSCIGTTVTPTVSIAALPSGSICSGTNVNFTATATNTGGGTVTYNFKVNGNSMQNSSSNMYATNSLANGDIVSCDISISGGTCISSNTASSNTITMSVTSALIPTVGIAAIPSGPICSGTLVNFTATANNTGGGIVTYNFKVNGNSVQNTLSNMYSSNSLANNNTVSCDISISSGSCLSSNTASSNIITMAVSATITPTVTLSSVPSSPICIGTSVLFSAIAANLGGGTVSTYNFKINGNSVQNTSSNTYTTTGLINGNNVTCDISITGGVCLTSNTASSNTLNFIVNNRPINPETAPDQTFCYSGSGSYQLSVETSSPPYGATADWYDAATGGNLVQSNTNDISIFITPTGPYPHTYTFWKEFRNISTGCVSLNRAPVNFIFILQPDLVQPPAQSNPCPATSFNLGSIALVDNNNTNGTLTYYATLNDAENGSPTISPIVAMSGTYYIRKDIGNNCYDIVPVVVNINTCVGCPNITALSVTSPLCSNSTTTLTASGLNNMAIGQNGEANFGIRFKYFNSSQANPYIGGTVIGTVPFASLSMNNTVAVLMGASLPSGNLFVYAILSPASSNSDCVPFASQQVTVNLPASVTESHMNPSCPGGNNGFINLGVVGIGPFNYFWTTTGGSGLIQGVKDQNTLTSGSYNVTVSDNNGCTKTLTIVLGAGVDLTPPVLTCPINITIQCNAITLPANTGTATATDNCSSATVTFSDVNNYNGCGGYTGTISRTWTAKDAANNMATCTQVITVSDNIGPIAICKDVTVSLNSVGQASVTAVQINNGSTDICTPQISLVLGLNQTTFNCANLGMNTVILRVTDLCGNSATCAAKVTVQDNTPPTITCPGNLTIECNANKLPPATGTATGLDNCSISTPTFTDVNNFNGCGGYTGTITRTWKVTDPAGNTATCNQIITVKDNTAPIFNAPLPVDITVSCENPVPTAPSLTASDNCTASVSVTLDSSTMTGTCASGSTIIRTWTATDACGNTSTITQKITVVDLTPPVFLPPLPADVTVSCGSLPAVVSLTATDNCSGSNNQPAPSLWFNELHYDNTGTDVGEFIEVAGTAGLDLSNYSIILYNGSGGAVYDTKVLSGVIPNQSNGFGAVSFSYPSNGIQNGSPDGMALINNTTNAVLYFLSYEGTFVAVGGQANGMSSTDIGVTENGNEAVGMSLRLTGTGSTYSSFSWQAVSTETPGAINQGQTMVAVNLPPTGTITYSYTELKIPGSCPTQGTINRTYTATDACGNTVAYTQHITVKDTEAPLFVMPLPLDITVECDAIPAAPIIRTIDRCPLFNAPAQNIWINEFHYDNTGTDVGEFIEVAGPAGTDLSQYSFSKGHHGNPVYKL